MSRGVCSIVICKHNSPQDGCMRPKDAVCPYPTTMDLDCKTNADHIRSMTDEELAEFLMSDICGTVSPKDFDCYGACIDCTTIWLRQPYKEATDD